MLAKKTSKNQLTLPKEIAGAFPGIDYFDVSLNGASIMLRPVKLTPADLTLEGLRGKLEKLGITPHDVGEAVQWARKGIAEGCPRHQRPALGTIVRGPGFLPGIPLGERGHPAGIQPGNLRGMPEGLGLPQVQAQRRGDQIPSPRRDAPLLRGD